MYIRSGTDQFRSFPDRPTRLRGRKTTIFIQLGSRSLSGKITIYFLCSVLSFRTDFRKKILDFLFVCLFCLFVCCLFVFCFYQRERCTLYMVGSEVFLLSVSTASVFVLVWVSYCFFLYRFCSDLLLQRQLTKVGVHVYFVLKLHISAFVLFSALRSVKLVLCH